MIVSPFTPLFFIDRKADGIDSDYIQTFAPSDRILVQLIGAHGSWDGEAVLYDALTGKVFFTVPMSIWQINSETDVVFAELSLNPGFYYLSITGIGECRPFRVTDDPRILNNTTLIQYSMKDNRQRKDAVFFIDGMQYFFDFRVHGGFKDSGWAFAVESEQFTAPTSDIVQLFGMDSTQKTFTLGGNRGVPVWFGEMLNRILVCSYVYFDGKRYGRLESNVPEINQQLEGLNSFVFTQLLQRSANINPVLEENHRLIMRRVSKDVGRNISATINRKI